MKTLKRGEKGFTLIELLIVVAMLGILAAVILPNLGRFIGKGEEESRDAEYSTLHAALQAMMVDNGLAALPDSNLIDSVGEATSDMSIFPYSDGTYVLWGHSINGTTVNYLSTNTSAYKYYTDSLGTLFQVDS